MKKIYGVFLTAVFFLISGPLHSVHAAGMGMNASGVKGTVLVVRDGAESILHDGDGLQSGDRIKTDGDSQLDIIKPGGWGYRLLQSSDCVIHLENEKTEIEMFQGNVIFKVIPTQGRNLTVKTPVVVAAVRGTQFWGQVTPAAESFNSIFAVREGTVEVTVLASGEKQTLSAGQAIEVRGAEDSSLTRAAKQAELDAIAQIEAINLE